MPITATAPILAKYGKLFYRHPKYRELSRTRSQIKRLREKIDKTTACLSTMKDLFEKLAFRRHELLEEWIDVRYELVMAVRHGKRKAFKRTVRKETTI